MRWERRGLVYRPTGEMWWARTHAFLPTPVDAGGCIRVYLTSLDGERYGRGGFVELDRSDPTRVLHVGSEPLLELGPLGSFDDSGVNPSCVIERDGILDMYYIGWQRAVRVPYMLFTGLAHAAGERFERSSAVPVLDRTPAEPFSRSAPFVLEDGDGRLRMWYWTCVSWTPTAGGARYRTAIEHASSDDGVRWQTTPGGPCLEPTGAGDYAVGRPWVAREGDGFLMWYSIRSLEHGLPYRIAYAESSDGLRWTLRSDCVLPAVDEGWDSRMSCLPAVLDVDGRRFLFYNGNGIGASGFGCAELVG
jgi:hypothetical protein